MTRLLRVTAAFLFLVSLGACSRPGSPSMPADLPAGPASAGRQNAIPAQTEGSPAVRTGAGAPSLEPEAVEQELDRLEEELTRGE